MGRKVTPDMTHPTPKATSRVSKPAPHKVVAREFKVTVRSRSRNAPPAAMRNCLTILHDGSIIDEHFLIPIPCSLPPFLLTLQGRKSFFAQGEHVFPPAPWTDYQVAIRIQQTHDLTLAQTLKSLSGGKFQRFGVVEVR